MDQTRPERQRRSYHSPHRERQAAQTRRVVLAAAAELFNRRGWAGTGIRDVAAAAGVSVETVYSTVGSKADLLVAVRDVGIVGDDAPLPLAARPEFAALGSGDRAKRSAAAAKLVTQIYQRTARLDLALREAAAADERLAHRLREDEERRREQVALGAQLVAGRPPSDDERDSLWAVLSPEVYLLLTDRSGWTSHQYQTWAAQQVQQLFDE